VRKKPKVLLVDDDQRFVRNTSKLLSNRGFEVVPAFEGLEALKKVDEQGRDIDVVVLDMKMPGMDGVSVLEQIKRIDPDLEVIMLTGYATSESGIEAIRQGAFDYLVKPCEIEDLTAKIRQACEVESIRRKPLLWPRRKIREISKTGFVPLDKQASIQKAFEVFNKGKEYKPILHVYDSHGNLEGIITREDILQEARKRTSDQGLTWNDLRKRPELVPDAQVSDLLRTEDILCLHPDMDIKEGVDLMIQNKVNSLPVVEQGKLLGIIRLKDLLAYASLLEDFFLTWPGSTRK